MNSDFADLAQRQSDRRKLLDLNLIRKDPINPRKALDFKLSPYGDIQTRSQNRYSTPPLNSPSHHSRNRYSTEADRYSAELDSSYKLDRIRANLGNTNRYSQGSTDNLHTPKFDKQKENARNVVTRAVSQKMLSETGGSQPNLSHIEAETVFQHSPGVTERNMFYTQGPSGGMTSARSHQNLHQTFFYNDRRSSQPGSPLSPVSPAIPAYSTHSHPPYHVSAYNGVPIQTRGSPDGSSLCSDSPNQQEHVPKINGYPQHRQHMVHKQAATNKPPAYNHHMATSYRPQSNFDQLPQKLAPPSSTNVKLRHKPSNMGVNKSNRVSCPCPPPQYCWTQSGHVVIEKRTERALSGTDFCNRSSDPFMDIDNSSRPTSGYDSDYRVGSQASSDCQSDMHSGVMTPDWMEQTSVMNMPQFGCPPAYTTVESRSDYASSENSSHFGLEDPSKYSHNGYSNDSVVTVRQSANDVTMRSPTTSPNQSTDYAIRQEAEKNKKRKGKAGIFGLFRSEAKQATTITSTMTEKITTSMATTTLDEFKDSKKQRKFKSIREIQPRAFKFYMEQRIDNLMKAAHERIERKRALESEMCGHINTMSETDRDNMRQLLRKKETQYLRLTRAKLSMDQFTTVKQLGKGAFGSVSLVIKKDSNAYYALKILNKKEVVLRKQIAHVKAERDILKEADNDWIVKLYYSFQDTEFLYFVMEYIPGGDLMALLIREHKFNKPLSQFYTAELVQAVASVHEMGFIHRDIKPDNVLIGRDGHIKLTDFGLCTGFRWTHDSEFYKPGSNPTNRLHDRKNILHRRKQARSVVGTPNYIAPEVLQANGAPGQGYTKSCDWWSVGVILFEMIIGQPPFAANTPLQTQEMILAHHRTFRIPSCCPCPRSSDLMQSWIVGEENRLSDPMLIRNHPFFAGIKWDKLRHMQPPYVPKISSIEDTSNFDPVEADMNPSPPENEADPNHTLHQAAFVEFTFRRFFDQDGIPHTSNTQQQPSMSRPVVRRTSHTPLGNTFGQAHIGWS